MSRGKGGFALELVTSGVTRLASGGFEELVQTFQRRRKLGQGLERAAVGALDDVCEGVCGVRPLEQHMKETRRQQAWAVYAARRRKTAPEPPVADDLAEIERLKRMVDGGARR